MYGALMSTEKIYNGVLRVLLKRVVYDNSLEHLDVGAGTGDLISLLATNFRVNSQACDYHTERFALKNVPIKRIDLNNESFPYADESFNIITSSEVIEHLENFRSVLREMRRILKEDGILVLTTPNVLNVNSRIRYLVSGFANLFGPLPVKHDEVYSCGGHINPVPFFYIAHALADADFADIQLDIDKVQRSSVLRFVIFWPVIMFGWIRFLIRENKKYRTISKANSAFVNMHFSPKILFGRTVIVSARKNCMDIKG
jgi:SAM-dependent methyltransferase